MCRSFFSEEKAVLKNCFSWLYFSAGESNISCVRIKQMFTNSLKEKQWFFLLKLPLLGIIMTRLLDSYSQPRAYSSCTSLLLLCIHVFPEIEKKWILILSQLKIQSSWESAEKRCQLSEQTTATTTRARAAGLHNVQPGGEQRSESSLSLAPLTAVPILATRRS